MADIMVEMLATLAHSERLSVFRLLVRRYPQAIAAGDLAQILGFKRSTLSVYLAALRRAGLIHQDRAGNFLLYSADMDGAGQLLSFLLDDCCRGRFPSVQPNEIGFQRHPAATPFNVLFICSGNSVRSIFAEAILRTEGSDRFTVYSAGTRPYSELNPITMRILEEHRHPTHMLRSKNISEFRTPDAPKMDFVFTVCDQAADEECPTWPGQPLTAHWGHPDPVRVEGSDALRYTAFRDTYHALARRIRPFAQLGFEALERSAIQREIDNLGRLPLSA